MLSVSWIDLLNVNDGESGIGISSTLVEYAVSNSGTVIPGSFMTDDEGHVLLDTDGNPLYSGIWSTEIPTTLPGEWLWTRTTQFYTDGTSTVSYNVSRNGENPYTIILSNENHTFPASWDTAVESSTICNVYGYQGGNKIPVTIGDITGIPTGMTVSIQNNGTLNSRFIVSVNEEMIMKNGTLTIPITIGDLTFEKLFTYSLAFNGAPGNGINNITEMYAVSTSISNIPEDNKFTTSIPSLNNQDRCLWNYEIIDYSDGSVVATEKHVIGMYSEDGRSIESVKNYYLASTQSTGITIDTTGWTEIPQPISENLKYLWNYETITYSTGEYDSTEPVIIGVHGDSAITYSMQISHAAVVLDNTGKFNPKSITVSAKYQQGNNTLLDYYGRFIIETSQDNFSWTRKYVSSSNETAYTYTVPSGVKSIRVALYMAEGTNTLLDQQTIPIITDGIGISSVVEYYAVNNSSSAAPPNSSFDTVVPTMSETNKFLWNFEEVTYTDGHIERTDKVVIGVFGADGRNGRGIDSITECYLATSVNSGVTTSTSGWTTTIQTITPEKKYLWNYEIINYTTGDPESTTPVIIGTYGEQGDDAYTVILSNESHTFSGGTSSAVAGSTTCNVIGYKGATQEDVTIGEITGCPTGMTVAISNNNSTSASFTVTVTTSMNTRNGILNIPVTIDGKTINKQFSYSLAVKGDKGDAATIYSLTISHAAIVLQDNGQFNPTSILLHAKSQRGDGQLSDYAGRFKIDVSSDDSAWRSGYASTNNESSCTFTIPSGIKSVRCSLYLANGMTTLIDQQVIPVLSDGIGIASVTEYYAVNKSSSSAPKDNEFSTGSSIPSMTATDRFLWNYELVTYTDGSTVKTDKVVIGVWGEQGNSGKGISSIKEYYLATPENSNITISTSGWTDTIQIVTNTNKYLWNYEVVEYTDGESTTTTPVIIGVYGDKGEDGTDGYTVVLSNESHTFSGDTTSAIASNTTCNVIGYKGTTQQKVTIGTITGCPTGMSTTISNNGTINASFKVSVTNQMISRSGLLTVPCTIDGKTFNKQFSYSLTLAGETTTIYNLLVSNAIISRTQNGQYNPPTITIQAYKQAGSSMELYNGRFKIETTINNENWTQNYISQKDESSMEFVVPSSNSDNPILAIKFSLYTSGETEQMLDYQTVPIINDGTVGNGIKEYTVEYAVSDSDTIIPGGPYTDGNNPLLNDNASFSGSTWSSEIPQNIPDGLYLWTRVKFIFTDGEESVAYSISKYGENGKDGKDGTYIVKQNQQFYISTSRSELIGGTWSYEEPEELNSGEYIWKRFENIMSDTSILYSEAYCESIMGGVVSLVDEVEKQITNRVWQSDIRNIVNEYDGSTAKQIRDRVTEMEQDVDGMKYNLSDISSTVKTKADGSEVKDIIRRVQEVTDTASEHTRIISEDIMGSKNSSIKSIAQQTANKFSWLVGNSGTGTSTTFTLTDRVAKLVADDINLYGMVTFHGLAEDAQDIINTAQNTADLANEKANVGLGMKINYSAFNTENFGECYLHGYDEDGNPADIDGYVYWNNRKIIVNKTMIDPNIIPPYWKTVYLVLRLSSASANSGTLYMVWYNTGWKYAVTPTPNNIKGTWLWNEERDIVLGQFVETASEGKIVDAYLYMPPRNASIVRAGVESQYHDWIYNNGTDIITAKDIIGRWATDAKDATTTIKGGLIQTHTILSQALATNAIMSQNYSSGADDGEDTPAGNFSITGSYLDLETGNFFTPNFGIKGGNAYFKGDIHALSGELGGWVIDEYRIYYKNPVPGISGSATIYPSGAVSSIPIGGSETTDEKWLMTVSDQFGVTTDGKLYCNDAIISGAINATSLTISPGVTFPGVITSDNIVSSLIDVDENGTEYTNNKVDSNWSKYNYLNNTYMKANNSVSSIYLSVPLKKCHFSVNDTIEISFDYIATSTTTSNSYTLTAYIYYYGDNNQKLQQTDSVSFTLDPSTSTEKSVSKILQLSNYPNNCRYYRLLFSVSSSANLSRTLFRNIKGLWTSFSPIATSGDYSDLLNKPNLTIYIAKDGTVGEEPTEGATGFKVDKDGVLTAANAIIWGRIFASSGEIGGCSINEGFLEVDAAHISGVLTADKLAVGLGVNLVEVDELKNYEYNQTIDDWIPTGIRMGNNGAYRVLVPTSTSPTESSPSYERICLTRFKKYDYHQQKFSINFDYIRYDHESRFPEITFKAYTLKINMVLYDREYNYIKTIQSRSMSLSGTRTSSFGAIKSDINITLPSDTAVYYKLELEVSSSNKEQLLTTIFKNIVIRQQQTSDTIAEIGGWTVGTNDLTKGTLGSNDSIYLATADLSTGKDFAGAGSALKTWRLGIGENFGVTKEGDLYAKTGKIGCFNVDAAEIKYTYEVGHSYSSWYYYVDGEKYLTPNNTETNFVKWDCLFSRSRTINNKFWEDNWSHDRTNIVSYIGINYTANFVNTNYNTEDVTVFCIDSSGNLYTDESIHCRDTIYIDKDMFINKTHGINWGNTSYDAKYLSEKNIGDIYTKKFDSYYGPNGFSCMSSDISSISSSEPSDPIVENLRVKYGCVYDQGRAKSGLIIMKRWKTDSTTYQNKLTLKICNDGTIYCKSVAATGSVTQNSDERKKDIICDDLKISELFMNINPIAYNWKNDEKSIIHFGVGAQTLERTIKKCGYKNLDLVKYNQENDSYSVNYTELQMLTIPVVQDHEYRIRALEEENEKLRKQIQLLTNGEV